MYVHSFRVQNLKSFEDSGWLELSPINLLVGRNNAGKSALLRALYGLQAGSQPLPTDRRAGSSAPARLEVVLAEPDLTFFGGSSIGAEAQEGLRNRAHVGMKLAPGNQPFVILGDGRELSEIAQIGSTEPDNLIYPFLSHRKQPTYRQTLGGGGHQPRVVQPTLQNLTSKVSRMSETHPNYAYFREVCMELFEFVPGVVDVEQQHTVGRWISDSESIPVEAMGDGVAMALGLVLTLAGAKNRLFLIEEPENDLHPAALKALLGLILRAARSNQFVISTHSNVVTTYLGAEPTTSLFQVSTDRGAAIPTSTVRMVDRTVEARTQVLQDLGYALSDSDLYEGWLIVEEATAEAFVRQLLVPWFAPKLSRVRTVSGAGVDRTKLVVDDFVRVFLYAHLEDRYRGRAWVMVDGDDAGRRVITELRAAYPDWPDNHFVALSKPDIEGYYPERFADAARNALATTGWEARRTAKNALFQTVRTWAEANPEAARGELAESAEDLIAVLHRIESEIV
jgi:predicted ATPase